MEICSHLLLGGPAWSDALSRSASFTERDLKEAKAQSQRIAAQLTTPPSSNSRGVLLFNRRRQRVNEFTFESRGRREQAPATRAGPGAPPLKSSGNAPALQLRAGSQSHSELKDLLVSRGPGGKGQGGSMEEFGENPGALRKAEDSSTHGNLERSSSEEAEEIPLVVYLKENAALLTANGLHLTQSKQLQDDPPPADAKINSPTTDQSSPVVKSDTAAADINRNPPATDDNKNVTGPDSQTPPVANLPSKAPLDDAQPGALIVDIKPHAPVTEVKSNAPGSDLKPNTLVIDVKPTAIDVKLSAPILDPGCNAPAADIRSNSLIIDVKSIALVDREQAGPTANEVPHKQYSEVHLTLSKPQSVVNRTARPFGAQSQADATLLERSPRLERRTVAERSPAVERRAVVQRSPAVERRTVVERSPVVERHTVVERQSPVVERHSVVVAAASTPVGERPAVRETRPMAARGSVLEKRPGEDFTPPPTYAETLSSPPPVSRVRSPPSYSALYPSAEHRAPVLKGLTYGEGGPVPAGKTGILEEAMARRGNRKSMFTFVEKPKVTPNPDLLDLVQTADEKRKQREQGEAGPDEEPFELGAEASNFQNEALPRERASPSSEDALPEWSSCLKSPSIRARPQLKPNQNLTEASGKGAELYARRQSRMEKYVIEAPGQADPARCPSPTMSLPPSWKYSTNVPGFPPGFPGSIRIPSRSPARTPPASLYHGYKPENGTSRREAEPPKQQPSYQLQPSLFVLSPSREPSKALPRAASPCKPGSLNLDVTGGLTPRPGSPFPPSPALPRAIRSSPGPYASPSGSGSLTQDCLTAADGPAYSRDVSPVSPSRAWSPRAKGPVSQAPRPSFSTRNAGIEPQERCEPVPASPTRSLRLWRPPSSLDGWVSPSPLERPPVRAHGSPSPSERSLSPPRPEVEPKMASRQLQALLARNIINAARRKSSSPASIRPHVSPQGPPGHGTYGDPRPGSSPSSPSRSSITSPRAWGDGLRQGPGPGAPRPGGSSRFSPICRSPLPSPVGPRGGESPRTPALGSPLPSPGPGSRGPARAYGSRSPTDSDVSLDSEDSGAKSPGIRSYNICPRGWSGALRLKRPSLPSQASCTS
ncbi:synaptopodin isoform X2 [Tachyglossus aculeatus]|uniref:synaptopodin isoform X2 n=1 Tax=Tachyglossus aculeatus TaxID=9261 RepID=UPI0018F43E83|nr:synaptopodin isoform X2 [Tachyglossus aculeatus]